MARVSATVLNYNGRHLLEIILPSLAAQSFRDFEIVVVDNASSDDSIAYLESSWPQVRVVSTGPENVDVTAALNVGVAAAQGEFVALLNNDIELEPTWLQVLVDVLDAEPELGSAAGKLRNYYRRTELDGAGDVFLRGGAGGKRGNGHPDRGQFDRPDEVLCPTGGAGLYRASALASVGPFDEWLHAYFEDVDWGLRAQALGLRCRYTPEAVGYHMAGATTGDRRNPRYVTLQQRNTVAILLENVPLRYLIENAPRIALHQLRLLWRSTREGLLRSHLRGTWDAVMALPLLLRERRHRSARCTLGGGDYTRAISVGLAAMAHRP
jgi:GT2 family glycosyltransferase